ncbi:MAG TPA: pilus assembly protein N-terminal domain-containing protein [Rhizomicrobium sp.]|nr:pilus assembly protein N-terminal domain-containing protein [Rhizomicrobium sp.]
MRRALFAVTLLAATPVYAAVPLHATKPAHAVKPVRAVSKNDFVALALDEVHTLTFRTPVSTVYVGNPTIADVTMIDARHAFVQGKGYGRTNIMALNRDNVMVFNTHVSVTGNQGGGTVTLNRGAQRVTLNCAGGRCEPTPMPGDGKDSEAVNGQLMTHQTAARSAALAEAKN